MYIQIVEKHSVQHRCMCGDYCDMNCWWVGLGANGGDWWGIVLLCFGLSNGGGCGVVWSVICGVLC